MNLFKPAALHLTLPLMLFLIILIILAFRAYKVLTSVKRYQTYWTQLAERPGDKDGLVLVALGDSTMQAIGASKPEEGIIGHATVLIRQKTGKQPRVINLSRSGARINDVINQQLPKLEKIKPDIILISVGANDAKNKTNDQEYEQNYKKLLEYLPPEISIYANTPDVDNRNPYEEVFKKLTDNKNIKIAQVYENVYPHRNNPLIYAGDFFHPSNKGYSYWFKAYQKYIIEIIKV